MQKPIRPLPLPASLRNPWFLRSRSAPPSPRRANDTAELLLPEVSTPPVNIEGQPDNVSEAVPVAIEGSASLAHIEESPPPPADESDTPKELTLVSDTIPVGAGQPRAEAGLVPTIVAPVPVNATIAPIEAILLERRRRQALTGASSHSLSGDSTPRRAPGTPKGKAFKSSPLEKSSNDSA